MDSLPQNTPATGLPKKVPKRPLYFLDNARHCAVRNGIRTEKLTVTEFQIAAILLESEGYSVPKTELEEKLWEDSHVTSNTIHVHLFHLRRKLKVLNLAIEAFRGILNLREVETK